MCPGGVWMEYRGAVTVLERQPDAAVTLDRTAHRVTGHQPQQLPAGSLIRRRDLVAGELAAAGLQLSDHGPGIGQRGADAADELRIVDSALVRLVEQSRGNGERHAVVLSRWFRRRAAAPS